MISGTAQGPDPPFRGRQRRRVDYECLVFRVPRGGRFQSSHIGPVAQFGLRIAADELVFLGFLKKELVLFGRSLFAEGDLAVFRQCVFRYTSRQDDVPKTYSREARTVSAHPTDHLPP